VFLFLVIAFSVRVVDMILCVCEMIEIARCLRSLTLSVNFQYGSFILVVHMDEGVKVLIYVPNELWAKFKSKWWM
jgi:hypothetical protein